MKNKNFTDKEARRRIINALTGLILDEEFFGALASRLDLIEDRSIKTEATNGKFIRYNPDFIKSIPFAQVKAELCHEVMHCVKGHPWRREGRDQKVWNYATDFVINAELQEAGFQLDNTWLVDPQYKGMSEEQVYGKLAQQSQQQQDKLGEKQGNGHGEVEDAQDDISNNGQSKEDLQQEWKQAIITAAKQAKANRGKIPGCMETLVNDILHPAVDWKSVLRKFIEQTARNDFTFVRPSTRYIQQGCYMPSLRSEQTPAIVLYWDTSGSRWSNDYIVSNAAEVASIIKDAMPEKLVVIYGDTAVTHVQEFTTNDVVDFKPKGGGGTMFEPIFEYIEANEIEACCFIGLTDLEGSFPNAAPSYPVLWLTDNKQGGAPFGEVLYIDPRLKG